MKSGSWSPFSLPAIVATRSCIGSVNLNINDQHHREEFRKCPGIGNTLSMMSKKVERKDAAATSYALIESDCMSCGHH